MSAVAAEETVVHLRGLRRAFGDAVVLDGLDLDVTRGDFVALLGRSGSGKTTLLRTLARLDKGSVGDSVETGSRPAVVFQDPRLLPWRSVIDNVRLGLRTPEPFSQARAAIEEVGLGGREQAWPRELSGGQRQRVALARALVREPDLLLLDEPFSSLDALTRSSAQSLVDDLWQRHRPAILLVTHDVEEALVLADRILVLEHGRIVRDERVEIPRPRRRDDGELVARRADLLRSLGVGDDA